MSAHCPPAAKGPTGSFPDWVQNGGSVYEPLARRWRGRRHIDSYGPTPWLLLLKQGLARACRVPDGQVAFRAKVGQRVPACTARYADCSLSSGASPWAWGRQGET